MGEPFGIAVTQEGGAVTLVLSGELDLSGIAAFDEAVGSVGPDARSVSMDLGALTFVDSSGIGCFVRARSAGLKAGWTLVLRSPSPLVRKVMDVIDLGESIEIVD